MFETERRAWRRGWTLLLALAATCGVAACDQRASRRVEAESEEEPEPDKKKSKRDKGSEGPSDDKDSGSSAAAVDKPANKGRFVYKMEPATKPEHKSLEPLFKDPRFANVVQAMEVFALPRDVPVFTADVGPCAQANAFYMPAKHAVFLCYPMAKVTYENFIAMGKSDQEASNLTRDAMTFILLHEIGHALIGELELGVTGKEEDAVDELAALILIQNGKHDMAIAGTYALVLLHQFQGKGKPSPFFGEHAVSEARLYDMFCLILGSDPKKFGAEILRERPELKQRAPKCPGTYQKIDKAWTQLLAPHSRKASAKD